MVIYGPTHVKFDEDLGPFLLQDCTFFSAVSSSSLDENILTFQLGFHLDYFTLVKNSM